MVHNTRSPGLNFIHGTRRDSDALIGDDVSEKDLVFAMLMSTGDGSGNIKADWQKVEKIMISWGYSFTIGAMCKSSHVDAHLCFPTFPRFGVFAAVGLFTRRPRVLSPEVI